MPVLLHSKEDDAVGHHLEISLVCSYLHCEEQEGTVTYSALVIFDFWPVRWPNLETETRKYLLDMS